MKGLGRGLSALIPAATAPDPAADPAADPAPRRKGTSATGRARAAAPADPATEAAVYAELALDAIRPNPRQPRQVFDDEALGELVHSLKEIGLLQPVVVRPVEDGYELVAGERRWRAARLAGFEAVPAIVRQTADDELLREALLENLHRVQLNALEEAAAYAQLLEDFGGTQEQLAARLGRSRPQVANTLRLLKLPPAVARRVAAGVLSAGHARALLSLDDAEAMEALAERVVAEGWSVRSLEEFILVGDADGRTRRRTPRPRQRPAAEHSELAERLEALLDTRVQIAGARRGRITIEYADADDLERIIDLLDPS